MPSRPSRRCTCHPAAGPSQNWALRRGRLEHHGSCWSRGNSGNCVGGKGGRAGINRSAASQTPLGSKIPIRGSGRNERSSNRKAVVDARRRHRRNRNMGRALLQPQAPSLLGLQHFINEAIGRRQTWGNRPRLAPTAAASTTTSSCPPIRPASTLEVGRFDRSE